MEGLIALWDALPVLVQILLKIVLIMVPLMLMVAYYTYAERKVIGHMQVRMGPNRVGFFGFRMMGLGQPIADAVKLMFKEIVIPSGANKLLFLIAPMLSPLALPDLVRAFANPPLQFARLLEDGVSALAQAVAKT